MMCTPKKRETFTWKSDGKIFKGVGIYHLTFRVAQSTNSGQAYEQLRLGTVRGKTKQEIAAVVQPLLDAGEACDASNPKYVAAVRDMAWVELTQFGKAVDDDLRHFQDKHDGVMICARRIMDNHIHIVVWVQQSIKQSIKQIAHGFRMGITHIAKDMGVWPVGEHEDKTPVAQAGSDMDDRSMAPVAQAGLDMNDRCMAPVAQAGSDMDDRCLAPVAQAGLDMDDRCVRGGNRTDGGEVVSVEIELCHDSIPAGLVLEQAFIRTLARRGQLRTMIDYVILNPYRRWILVLYPELFKLHRTTTIAGLKFRSMGCHWLLDWPVRQMVECRRASTQEDWDSQLRGVMERALAGAVTYTAAMNEGECYIKDKLLESGCSVVLLLKDGFPPAGSKEEDEYKPGGLKSDRFASGRYLEFEAYPETYEDVRIVEMTEIALRRKSMEKHQYYSPLPHSSLRWRSIACNEIMRLLSERNLN